IEEKGFTLVEHPSKVYKILDSQEYIDRNQPLHPILDIDTKQKPDPTNSELPSLDSEKISREDLMSKILIAYIDALSLIPECMPFLQSFALASSSNTNKCSWHIVYSHTQFIDYRELKGFMKKVIELVGELYSKFIDNEFKNLEDYLVQPKSNYSVIWPQTFSDEKPAEEEFKLIDDDDTLVKGANLVIEKYEWLQIGRAKKGFINFQCYWQKQYKPDHKGLSFDKVSDKVESEVKLKKWGLIERLLKAVKHPRPLVELSGNNINVKEMENAPEAYSDFMSEEPTTTLIRSPIASGKTKTLREILNSLAKNVIIVQVESTHRLNFHGGRSHVVILDESAVHVVAMDTFANESTLAFLRQYWGSEAIHKGLEMLKEDRKQRQDDFADINAI
ncbi:2269_t:CDS:2, partial [Scutellospora calospora]